MSEQYVDPAYEIPRPEVHVAGVTNILEAPSLRGDKVKEIAPKEFKDHQKGYSDADPTPGLGNKRSNTSFITYNDKAVSKGQFRNHGETSEFYIPPNVGIATRLLGRIARNNVVARTEAVNSGVTTQEISITRLPEMTEVQSVIKSKHESQVGFAIRRQQAKQKDFLKDSRVSDVDDYIKSTDEADAKSAQADWPTQAGPKVNK